MNEVDENAWTEWLAYRKAIRKPLKEVSWPAARKRLASFGPDQAAVVEQSIANGWQGLFALKDKPKKLNGMQIEQVNRLAIQYSMIRRQGESNDAFRDRVMSRVQ